MIKTKDLEKRCQWLIDKGNETKDTAIIVFAPSFRRSKMYVQKLYKMLSKNKTLHFYSIRVDQAEIIFSNGSSVVALSIGDGAKIRGINCDYMCIEGVDDMPDEILTILRNTASVANIPSVEFGSFNKMKLLDNQY